MKIEIALRSAVAALERIHVLGADADLLAGAIKALRGCIEAIEKAKKEAAENENHDGQGENA